MHRERAHTKCNFCRGGSTRGWKLVFSLFRESNRDDSISYQDWWAEVEAALAKGYEPERVKVAMFKAMEGMAKDHAANIDQYGVLRDPGRNGLVVWSVNDFPVTERSPLWATTTSHRNVSRLL